MCIAFLASAATAGTHAEGQAVAVRGGERETHDALTTVIAQALELPAEVVRIDLVGGVLPLVDSVLVSKGARDRWIATMWGSGSVARRFVRVGASRPVPVAVRTMERGEEIGREDVRMDERVMWEPVRESVADPIGMVTTRVVPEGQALESPSVRPPLLFRGGDEVEAVLERSGISMRVPATALGSAREGESVFVRLTSGKRMSGRAVGPGLVHLIPGGA